MLPRRRSRGLSRQPVGGRRPLRPLRRRPRRLLRCPPRPLLLQDTGGARVLRGVVAAAAAQRGGGGQADVAAEHGLELPRSLSGHCCRHMILLVLERIYWELAVLLHAIMKNEYLTCEIVMGD